MVEIGNLAKGIMVGLIGLILTMELLAIAVPLIQDSGDAVNATGVGLSSLFASDGLMPLIVVAAALVGVVALAFGAFKGAK